MVLRLRIRICYSNKCIDSIGIASSGFVGREPEITLPHALANELLKDVSTTLVEKVLADGSKTFVPRTTSKLDLYLVADDRTEGPVKVYAYITRSRVILLNDATLSALKVVIIDPFEGLWCFRDEIGKRERRGV